MCKKLFVFSLFFFFSWKACCSFGNPEVKWEYVPTETGWMSFSPIIADIDASPGCEIVAGLSDFLSTIFTLRADGSLVWSNSSIIQSDVWSSFTIARFSTGLQIIGGDTDGTVYSIDNNGTLLWTYQRGGPTLYEYSTPVVANLDTLGDPEILITGTNSVLYCLDKNGDCLWTHQLDQGGVTTELFSCSPVASDIDDDGLPEILIGCKDTLHCLSYDGTPEWSFHSDDMICSGVGIADLNLNGSPEILFPAVSCPNIRHVLYCLNSDGSLRWKCAFPTITSGKFVSTPAIADIDSNGTPDVVVWNGGNEKLYALTENSTGDNVDTLWTAEALDNTPVSAACPFICDIDGDADKDVMWIGASLGIYNGLDGKHPDNGGGQFYKNTSFFSGTAMERIIAVADLDDDGHVDIVGSRGDSWSSGLAVLSCTSWARCRTICPTYLYHITDVNDDLTIPRKEPQHWKTHNTWLTQLSEGATNVEEGNLGEQRLNDRLTNEPNPFAQTTVIRYACPCASKISLRVYDMGGRLVRTLHNGERKPGCYTVRWDGKDKTGKKMPSDIYFAKLETGNYKATKKLTLIRR
jgi:hypothetical protein